MSVHTNNNSAIATQALREPPSYQPRSSHRLRRRSRLGARIFPFDNDAISSKALEKMYTGPSRPQYSVSARVTSGSTHTSTASSSRRPPIRKGLNTLLHVQDTDNCKTQFGDRLCAVLTYRISSSAVERIPCIKWPSTRYPTSSNESGLDLERGGIPSCLRLVPRDGLRVTVGRPVTDYDGHPGEGRRCPYPRPRPI
ncbi:hypothetical protein B0H12DRAFT_153831 [Mycena haematopus]|nr:hypothetical protein B0H12DRAFT_153831 [Mycena haematopus]